MAARIKYLPIRYDQLEGLDELAGGLDEVRRLLRFAKASRLNDPLQCFFEMALVRYYNRDHHAEGLGTTAGHALYRISDLVPEKDRRLMPVRGPAGSLYHSGPSLEDWRAEWEQLHGTQIPRLKGEPLALPGL